MKTTFLERLIEEQSQLQEKIEKLKTALASEGFVEKVGVYQFKLLSLQYNAMETYKEVLDLRIEDLKTKQ